MGEEEEEESVAKAAAAAGKDWFLVSEAGTNPAKKGQTAREIARRTAPPDRILTGERSAGCAPATPRTAGPNSPDQTKNGAMVGGRKEQGAWGPRVVAACELGFGSCGGAASWRERTGRGGRRRGEKGRRNWEGEERRVLFYYFSLFVVDVGVETNKQSGSSVVVEEIFNFSRVFLS